MARVALQDEEQVDDSLQAQIDALQKDGKAMLYRDIDYTVFRKDVDPERAIKIIQWTFTDMKRN